MAKKPVIAIDFDGVIHWFPVFKKGPPMNKPIKDALKAISFLEKDYTLVIFTARDNLMDTRVWLNKQGISKNILLTNKKPKALYYIDDRAIEFKSWRQVILRIYDKHRNKTKE